jgi:hypothetical protein
VLDALATMLSVEPVETPRGADVERVGLCLALGRDASRDVGREL